jgi:hypothetical protein
VAANTNLVGDPGSTVVRDPLAPTNNGSRGATRAPPSLRSPTVAGRIVSQSPQRDGEAHSHSRPPPLPKVEQRGGGSQQLVHVDWRHEVGVVEALALLGCHLAHAAGNHEQQWRRLHCLTQPMHEAGAGHVGQAGRKDHQRRAPDQADGQRLFAAEGGPYADTATVQERRMKLQFQQVVWDNQQLVHGLPSKRSA